ncbi:MAG: SLAC1 anion channel family protein [Gammaproteobacteria bacterium]
MNQNSRIAYFPISFFAMIMGLSGLTIAWEKAQHVYALNLPINLLLTSITTIAFVILILVYGYKFINYRDQVQQEFRHPIKLNFFPTISISLILLSVIYLSWDTTISQYLWISGSSIHLVFTLYVVNSWIHHEHYEIHHLNPAWFIPAVGNVLVPIAGVPLGYLDVSWFFFSIGMIFWIILLTIMFYRILFHNPIADRLLPTMFILIAPPAVGFISYMKLAVEIDAFARILYFIGLFFTLLLFAQIIRFIKLKFFLSWWAYSFPVAAMTIASLRMFEITSNHIYSYISILLLVVLTFIVGLLLIRTLSAIYKKDICVKE